MVAADRAAAARQGWIRVDDDERIASPEPDFDTASEWWPDLRSIWTPIGWKNHAFRFNVFFNGTIVAQPDRNRRTQEWGGQGVQLTFPPSNWTPAWYDNDMVDQGWSDRNAPVLWSEWSSEGVTIRQEVFAHVAGGEETETGLEPLFAWVRLSVVRVCPTLPMDPSYPLTMMLQAPHMSTGMSTGQNITYHREASEYPRALMAESAELKPGEAYRVVEEDGRARLAMAHGDALAARLTRGTRFSESDWVLRIEIPPEVGSSIDLLVPMVPADREAFDAELKLGRDGALAEAEEFWSREPATAARIETPEEPINQAVRRSIQFAEIVAERSPVDGRHSLLTGSFVYVDLWATPAAMTLMMTLDTMGHHEAAGRYLDRLLSEQGTVRPPGEGAKSHPGYLSAPRALTAIDWLSDHGAILYAAAGHGLLSGDDRFIGECVEPMIKACDFIRDARSATEHGGVPGLMPPAVANDRGTQLQAVWNDGWSFKGLTTAVRLLGRIGHSRAEEFAGEAADYKRRFVDAFRAKSAGMPRWTDAEGIEHPLVPTALTGDTGEEYRHPFYLDTGPLFLVFAGLMDANDPLMTSATSWFREGPPRDMYIFDGDFAQVACLEREMSSCEPCYSWNVFHSHWLGDRRRFLEGMYSLFAGGLSRKTFTAVETRGGQAGITPALLPLYMARLAVVDDQTAPGGLHLLRLVPRAWVRADSETIFERIPTEFGPVTLRFRLDERTHTLDIRFEPSYRHVPESVTLHTPPFEEIDSVVLNGRTMDPSKGTVVLP